MSFNPYNLLRRTLVFAAALVAVAAAPAYAQSGNATKSDGSIICSSLPLNISTGPGGVVITCNTTTTNPPPASAGAAGTFTITSNGVALPWWADSSTSFTISRANGTTGSVTVGFTRGGGCGPLPLTDSVTFADGVTSMNVPVRTPNNDATCVFTLTSATNASGSTATSAATVGSPSMAYVFSGAGAGVPATTTPPPAPPPTTGGAFNCPALPADGSIAAGLPLIYGGGINGFLSLSSGQTTYGALPALSASGVPSTGPSGNIAVAITTNSPTSGTVEVSISHCPGVIDTNGTYAQGMAAGKCYASFPIDQNVHNIYWFETPGQSGTTATNSFVNQYIGYGISVCEAYANNGPWYVTTRYTFPGGGVHNMAWQWQLWGSNP